MLHLPNEFVSHATADVSVMLLGAKQDLESKREIDVEDGKRFAATHEISHFYEVSAKTGHNVGEAFFTFFQDVHRKAQGTVQEAAPQPPTPTQSSCCGPSAVLLDIEGTITSISFVKDVLFPYATAHVSEYLTDSWDSDECREDVARLRDQAREDEKSGMAGVPHIHSEDDPYCHSKECLIQEVVSNVAWLMRADRKLPTYHSGGVNYSSFSVYADAVQQIGAWHSRGIGVWIYSSGSVEAQKLLLKYSEAGDLLESISGHFDTAVGGKRDHSSYTTIAERMGVDAPNILFITDIIEEAKAAHSAKMKVAIAVRPGNAPLSDTDKKLFPMVEDFSSLCVTHPDHN
eukprot:Em0144g16a